MRLALDEARFAVGVSRPNPAVGAVVVKDGIVVGRGRTQRPGSAHAEVMALRDAGELARGAALFVTLEPCCHQGRTPPCTSAIIAAGIAEVNFAHADPNPVVRGNSRGILEGAGVAVYEGEEACIRAHVPKSWDDAGCEGGCSVLSASPSLSDADAASEGREVFHEVERFFEAYDYFVRNARPFVELKSAVSEDGYMGAVGRGGVHLPIAITGEAANCWNHELRAMSDAVLVGAGTLLADNPRLDVRLAPGNNPVKVVWVPHREFSAEEVSCLNVFAGGNCVVYSCVEQPALKGIAEAVVLKGEDFAALWKSMLDDLGRRGMHRLMVEPGAKLAELIFESGCWNRLDLWRSTDSSVEERLESVGAEGLSYPELPKELVARESYMAGHDVLTVFYRPGGNP